MRKAKGAASIDPAPPTASCRNCGHALVGRWCDQCGQKADDFHRSMWRLSSEVFREFNDFDGKFWRTVPNLLFNPGRLTREYIDGRRVSQLPPVRMFLVVVVVLFLAGGLNASDRYVERTSAQAANTKAGDMPVGIHIALPSDPQGVVRFTGAPNPQFETTVGRWSHAFVVLAALALAGLVATLFPRRKIYMYDHAIFALHSLSFLGLLVSLILLLDFWRLPGADFLLLLVPPHLLFHVRGAYGLSWLSAAWRTVVLLIGLVMVFFAVLIGVSLVGSAAAAPVAPHASETKTP